MSRNLSKKFFQQHGKSLGTAEVDSLEPTAFPKEAIATLANIVPSKKDIFFKKVYDLKTHLSNESFKTYSKMGSAAMVVSLLLMIFAFNIPVVRANQKIPEKYAIFTSKPLTLDTTNQNLNYNDSRAVKIDAVFKHFNCPLTGYGSKFVEEADKNDLPYWLVASISFQESSCGKKTPKLRGEESFNAWGWATYGDKVFMFDDWNQGIEVVSRYMNNRFYSRGITELCDIMKVYTPPSTGSWCRGVGYFKDFILNYKTPQE